MKCVEPIQKIIISVDFKLWWSQEYERLKYKLLSSHLPSLAVHQMLFITVTNQATEYFKHYFYINFSLIITKPVLTLAAQVRW